MKKISVIFVIIGVLAISAYIYVRHSLSTPGFDPDPPKNNAVATQPSTSSLDLRPAMVKKLQELVKKGSGGLYNLHIGQMEPDILNSRVELKNILITPDTTVFRNLELEKKAPDDVFRISVAFLTIEGLGLKDIISSKTIDLRSIRMSRPMIDVYYEKRIYNRVEEQTTLYQRIASAMDHFSADTILISDGTVISHDLRHGSENRFNDVGMQFLHVLVDSATQYSKDRFLFAKHARLYTKNYSLPSSDGLYDLKFGSIDVSAPGGYCIVKNIALQPRYSRKEFDKKEKVQKELYQFSISSLVFKQMDWWHLVNRESLIAEQAEIGSSSLSVYLNDGLPLGPPRPHNFPDQLIMRLPLKVNIATVKLHHLNIVYEEYNPNVGRGGKFYVDGLHGTITNLTNMPGAIQKNKWTRADATATLMHKVPAHLQLGFDLVNWKSGNFTARFESSGFEGPLLNPVAEPIGLFSIKRGTATKLSSQASGDNYRGAGRVLFLYNDLHIVPLKPDKDRESGTKKKTVTSFLANIVLIKNENPKNGETRSPDCNYKRNLHHSFFNLIWKTTFVGILKTIGAPEKLAYE